MSNPFILLASFCFGLCIGSFLNVCISRLPEGASIVSPGSRCPECKTPIHFYDNVPVLSWLWLKGKCRSCRLPIAIRYPLIELLTGGFALCTVLKYGLAFAALAYFIFIATLLVVTFIDIDHQIIPNEITLPGIPLFFAAAVLLPSVGYLDALIGIVVGGGSLYLVALIYYTITGTEGMGGGDIKLLAMIGAMIGWQGVLFTIFVSSVIGTLIGGTMMLATEKGMKFAVPFGPFLSAAAVLHVFFGQALINWYLYGTPLF